MYQNNKINISGLEINSPDMEELLYSSLQEIINTAGGEAIVPIKENFGSVTMMSPRLSWGHAPFIVFCNQECSNRLDDA